VSDGRRVCILSRKDLGPVTRVSREAQALTDAGHTVTVVSLGKPSPDSMALTPEVEYHEVTLDFWTRRRLAALRERHKVRLTEERKRERAAAAAAAAAGNGSRPAAERVRVALRTARRRGPSIAMSVPTALLLRLPEEPVRERVAEFAAMDPVRILGHYSNVISQPVASRAFADEVCRLLAGRTFDIVQAHDNYSLIAARRLADRTGADLIYDATEISEHRISVRRTPLQRAVDRFQRHQELQIFREARAMLTVGDGVSDWYARRYGIPRPVTVRNCRWFWAHEEDDRIRRDCGITRDEKLVVWFGYVYPAQGVETMVEAARHASEDVHFALIGAVLPKWRQFRLDVEARIEALGLGHRVHLLPPRDPNDLVPYASGGDVGIIPRPNVGPNVYWSMPNKFMEMVMARLPLAVSSELADIRVLMQQLGIGRTFDVGDPADVARTLEAMLEPAAYAELRRNVMAAAEELCWEKESRKYVELFAGPPARRRGTPAAAARS
jgi:glycosyltransferase involved in cell wall biosynthesis